MLGLRHVRLFLTLPFAVWFLRQAAVKKWTEDVCPRHVFVAKDFID